MPTALDEVTQAAVQLSPREKLALAELLIVSADAEGGVDEGAESGLGRRDSGAHSRH